MGRPEADQEVPVLLPADHDPRWLPDPIPASYYARGEVAPWSRWAAVARGWPARRTLAIVAVALAGVVVVGAAVRLAQRQPAAAAQRIALAPASPAATSPPVQPTPFVAAPTATPTATPSPTPTPRSTPTPSATTVTILNPRLQARRGRSVTLLALTAPRTACEIAVGYSPAPQLAPATANGAGAVSWTWRVSDQVRPGIYPIQVSCGGGAAGATITVS
jgi:hypothetical protein